MSTNTSSHNVETPAIYLARLTNLDEVSLLGDTESIVGRNIDKIVLEQSIRNYQESRRLFHIVLSRIYSRRGTSVVWIPFLITFAPSHPEKAEQKG